MCRIGCAFVNTEKANVQESYLIFGGYIAYIHLCLP